MTGKALAVVGILVAALVAGGAVTGAAAAPDKAAVDKAFEALKTYDWGQDRKAVVPLEEAVVASHGDAAARKDLETRLAAVLKTDAPRCAKDFACRQLSLIATAESVPALAALLADKDLSHMARYALERMPCPEAVKAMRDALPKLSGRPLVGTIDSLGVRRDAESVAAIAGLLGSADAEVAAAAVAALGAIGTSEAAAALGGFHKKAPEKLRLATADACLVCAERLVAAGKRAEAMAIYKSLSGAEQPKHVRLAATRGMLSAAGAKPPKE